MLAYWYVLKHLLADTYGYLHFKYALGKETDYLLVCLLTPISVLPAGTKINFAAQHIFIYFSVFLFLPTVLLFIGSVPNSIFWPVYGYFFASALVLARMSRITPRTLLAPAKKCSYAIAITLAVLFFVFFFLLGASRSFQFVSFSEIYSIRDSSEAAGSFMTRVASMYIFSFGGLFLAITLAKKRYTLAAFVLASYILWYGVILFKTAVLAPFWLMYIFVAYTFFKNSIIRYYVVLTIPFFIGVLAFLLYGGHPTGSISNLIAFFISNITVFRMYGIPGEAFSIYFNYFQTHQVTYWSDIHGINLFLHYPYGPQSIALMLNSEYGLGNYNGSFISNDSIAALGWQVLPLVSLVMGAVFVAFNWSALRLNPRFVTLAVTMPAFMFLERPLTTSLLTGGIIFLILYLVWMPPAWSGTASPIANE